MQSLYLLYRELQHLGPWLNIGRKHCSSCCTQLTCMWEFTQKWSNSSSDNCTYGVNTHRLGKIDCSTPRMSEEVTMGYGSSRQCLRTLARRSTPPCVPWSWSIGQFKPPQTTYTRWSTTAFLGVLDTFLCQREYSCDTIFSVPTTTGWVQYHLGLCWHDLNY